VAEAVKASLPPEPLSRRRRVRTRERLFGDASSHVPGCLRAGRWPRRLSPARPLPPNRALARGATRHRMCSTYVPTCQAAFASRAIMACHGGADVAEPVDAGDLKSPAPRGVRVRVPPSAPGTYSSVLRSGFGQGGSVGEYGNSSNVPSAEPEPQCSSFSGVARLILAIPHQGEIFSRVVAA
jgi:hypothetical protein